MSVFNLRSVLIGILATFTMDVLSAGAYKLHLIAPLPPRVIGRWFASVVQGHPLHSDISQAPAVDLEVAIAAPVHYAIGLTLGLIYLLASLVLGLTPRNPFLALGFALGTNLLPWLLMFPAMGYGWFGAHGPPETRLFTSSLISHGFYGIGLWLSTSILLPG
jgi:hypothetical protein